MDLRDCQKLANAVANQFNDDGNPFRGLARILEECGEVSAEIARIEQTGSKGYHNQSGNLERLEDELADVLINIAGLANSYGLELDTAMERKHQRFINDHGSIDAAKTTPDDLGTSKRVTVYCSSSDHIADCYKDAAAELGRRLGERGHTLIYGGGNLGLMGEVSRAAHQAGGWVRGVIFDQFLDLCGSNEHVDELSAVSSMQSRKRGLYDPADVYVTLPGGFGTFEELLEVLSFKLIKLHDRPIIILNTNHYYDAMVAQFDRCYEEQFAAHYDTGEPAYFVANTPAEVLSFIEKGC